METRSILRSHKDWLNREGQVSGDRTIDEMAFAWISWYDLSDEEYADQLTARKNQANSDDQ